jgi:hypothetical protein
MKESLSWKDRVSCRPAEDRIYVATFVSVEWGVKDSGWVGGGWCFRHQCSCRRKIK